MAGYEQGITLSMQREVCLALGLPASAVQCLTLDEREGLHVTFLIRDAEGRIAFRGNEPLTATAFIPREGRQVVPEERASRAQA